MVRSRTIRPPEDRFLTFLTTLAVTLGISAKNGTGAESRAAHSPKGCKPICGKKNCTAKIPMLVTTNLGFWGVLGGWGSAMLMTGFITVHQVAEFLGCNDRRVRALLAQGRIPARKDARGHWEVWWPFTVRPGRRGPDLRAYPTRRAPLVTENASKGSNGH